MTIGDTLFVKRDNIVVEGISDYLILDGFLYFLQKLKRISSIPKELAIIPVGGAGKISYAYNPAALAICRKRGHREQMGLRMKGIEGTIESMHVFCISL